MDKPIRVRSKTDTTTDDPAWATSQIDPTFLYYTVASTEAGTVSVVLTPEDDAVDPLTITYEADGADDDDSVAAGLAAAANVLAATSPGWDFLRLTSSSASAVLALAIAPTAQPMVPSEVVPGSMTLTPDRAGTMPVVAKGDGQGSLELTVTAVDSSSVPLAPGSGTINLQLIELVDRTEPRGASGPQNDTLGPSMVVAASIDAQPLNEPWVVAAPAGLYTVRMDTDASMPGSIDALEVHAAAIETPPVGAESVDTDNLVPGSVEPSKLSAASVAPAANAACALLDTTTEVLLTISDATNTAISTTSAAPGQRVLLRVTAAAGGGSYTLAVTTGTLTLNSVGETAMIQRNVADDAWFVVALTAGDAAGAAATVV